MSTSYLFESTMLARSDRDREAAKKLTDGMKFYTKRFKKAINGTNAADTTMVICAAEIALRPLRERLKGQTGGEDLLAELHEVFDDEVYTIDLSELSRTRKEAQKDDD